jgi:hypothetical protein
VQSKNKAAMTKDEREYVRLVKLLPCSLCDEGGGEAAPSEAHEIEQGSWFTAVALCASCHRGPLLGWHGERRMFKVKKMDLLDALAVTIRRLFCAGHTSNR